MSRVRIVVATSIALAACVMSACMNSTMTTVVLLDGSCSRVNLAAYRDAWTKVAAEVNPGDRLVLGRITLDVREFKPEFDVTLPAPWALLDNPLDRDERVTAFQAQVTEAIKKALDAPCSNRTAILDTLDVAAHFLVADARPRRRLIILSDMLEDSEIARFDKGLTARQAAQLLETRRRNGALPRLNDTDVFVVGAAASSDVLRRDVQRFWTSYFEAAGARLKPEHYGPVLFGL
jgi:hypothetical protein